MDGPRGHCRPRPDLDGRRPRRRAVVAGFPLTGKLDAFQWRVPVAELAGHGPLIEAQVPAYRRPDPNWRATAASRSEVEAGQNPVPDTALSRRRGKSRLRSGSRHVKHCRRTLARARRSRSRSRSCPRTGAETQAARSSGMAGVVPAKADLAPAKEEMTHAPDPGLLSCNANQAND